MKEGNECIKFLLFSDYMDENDEALDTPGDAEGEGQDSDKERRFDYKVIAGVFGGQFAGEDLMEMGVNWSSYLFEGQADDCIYVEDCLKVQLELLVYQHKGC